MVGVFKSEKEREKTSTMIEFYDVQENANYGLFSDMADEITCTFMGYTCKSKTEWHRLIAPFMQE